MFLLFCSILLIQHERSVLSVSPKGHDANYYSPELYGEEPVSCKDASASICQCVGCIMGVSMRVSLLCTCVMTIIDPPLGSSLSLSLSLSPSTHTCMYTYTYTFV